MFIRGIMIKVAFTFALILLCLFSCNSYEINTNNIQNDNEIADTNSKIAVSVASDNMYSFEFTNADRTNTMLTFEKKDGMSGIFTRFTLTGKELPEAEATGSMFCVLTQTIPKTPGTFLVAVMAKKLYVVFQYMTRIQWKKLHHCMVHISMPMKC